MNQSDVCRKRPRQWASSIPFIPTNGSTKEASTMRYLASAMSEMAAELQLDEQAMCQDLLGELSLSGVRK